MSASPRLALAQGLLPVRLGPDRPGLYRIADGAMFELDPEALATLAAVHAGQPPPPGGEALVAEAERLGLMLPPDRPAPPFPALPAPEVVPLHYLNLQITHRCPLRCRHCYHGSSLDAGRELPTRLVLRTLEDFAALGGLAYTIGGGEPGLHPGFWEINATVGALGRRAILLTSGLGIPPARAARLAFHAVRISLDGTQTGHELLRGKGTFAPTIRFALAVRDAGLALEVSTMLHLGSRHELPSLEELVRDELRARAWRVGTPFPRGAWSEAASSLALDPAAAADLAARFPGYGPAAWVAEDRPACDAQLLTVDADGTVGTCAMLPPLPGADLHVRDLSAIHRDRTGMLDRIPAGTLACRARGTPGPAATEV